MCNRQIVPFLVSALIACGGSAGGTSVGPTHNDASCSTVQPGPNGSFGGYRMFPDDHPFNTPIDKLVVHKYSSDWLKNCTSPSVQHLQLDLSIPYNIVPANTPGVTATDLEYNDKPYPNPWPFPADALIEGAGSGGDHHCLAFDVGDCKLYEVYNIEWNGSKTSFTASSGTVWDTKIDDPGNGSGADAAGLPILPLLLRYDEVITAHKLEHPLRFTCQFTQQGHIAPARASASSKPSTGFPEDVHDPLYPPMGMRVRLKAAYDPTAHGYSAPVVAILTAIKKYGLILADNSGGGAPLFISGADDSRLRDGLGETKSIFNSITIDDLEVVDTGEVVGDYW
jgi:hypothetical protein